MILPVRSFEAILPVERGQVERLEAIMWLVEHPGSALVA